MLNRKDFASTAAKSCRDGVPPLRRQPLSVRTKLQQQQTGDADESKGQLKRSSAIRKTVRFTPSTNLGSEKDELSPQEPADTDIFTQSPHASRGSVSSIDFPDHLRPLLPTAMEQPVEILQPVTYSPILPENADERITAAIKTGIIRSDTVRHKVGVLEYSHRALPEVPPSGRAQGAELHIDTTESHKRNLGSSSAADQPRRKKAGSGSREIYFTPTDVNSSKTFLSSPLNSPTLPGEYQAESEDDLPTPRATVSASLTRPPSAIYVGQSVDEADAKRSDVKNASKDITEQTQQPVQAAIQITPAQLDKLVVALAQSKLLREHLSKDWFDLEGVPENESIVSSFSDVSLPTLTSASSLYSRQNANSSPPTSDGAELPRYSLTDPHPEQTKREPSHAPRTLGGILVCDPRIYGTPAKYAAISHKSALGSRTFLTAPDTSEVECSLRIEPAQSASGNIRVFLQCVNHIVDRKSGKQASILSAEIDVTDRIAKAALSELAEGTSIRVEDIAVCASPTTTTKTKRCTSIAAAPNPRSSITSTSTFIDWLAIADDLQNRDQVNSMIETALSVLHNLSRKTASPSTLDLLTHLSRLADQHNDLLILRPTSYHADNITPHTIKIPYCSRRIFEDWYTDPRGSQAGEKIGESQAARMFQRGIVSSVAKRAAQKEIFKIEVFWEQGGRMRQVLRVVPMVGGGGGGVGGGATAAGDVEERIWCCFVLGERDLSE
ncbi:hypothetical protein CERZMDRAFT_81786 [Cercospora zeae-maydis SCOH1-5]|uniref:Uncharacterized protein n=1 Tax=Cercospora zeae-maydis SCOH1-5 TaxID=717836 RepID=A0A6A6FR40_9PEZI|nr:hypothetical protein CERZMDRAFT_81786 [Cercospora zeae-maydis SCOH1-5]